MEPKRNEDPADAQLRRFKDKYLFITTLMAIALTFGVCIFFLALQPNSSYADTALNGVIGLTLALAGYYVRGKSRLRSSAHLLIFNRIIRF